MARIIQFEGRQISVPDDATDEEIQSIVDGGSSPTAAASTAAPAPRLNETGLPTAVPQRSTPGSTVKPNPWTPPEPSYTFPPDTNPLDIVRHAASTEGQAGLAGVGDLLGSPVDIPLSLLKLGGWGYNELAAKPHGLPEFPNIDWTAGQTIKDTAANVSDLFGVPIWRRDQMTPSEQAMQGPIELGTGALIGGLGLASRGAAVADKIASGAPGALNWFDRQTLPYVQRPTAALGRDAGTGAGASVGQDVGNATAGALFPGNANVAPAGQTIPTNVADLAAATAAQGPAKPVNQGSPVADRTAEILGMLAGAVGGHSAAAGATGAWNGLAALPRKYQIDKNIPANQSTGQQYTHAQSDLAARVYQGDATDPTQAATTIRQNAADLNKAGVPAEATPTAGLLSGDQGLVNLETTFRTREPVDFINRDQAVKGAAADKVGSLQNPTADQTAVGPGIKGAVSDIKAERDLEALPLLMKAENSGAVANPQPVIDMIDNQLALVKRPSVRAALTEARKSLYQVGTDPKAPVIDTSISGLYEARKTINDIIAGRGENSSGQFAVKELSAVRDALDSEISKVAPEFGQYLQKFREGSAPLDVVKENGSAQQLIGGEDARNVAERLFTGYGGEDRAREVSGLVANDPKAAAGWKAAVAEVLVNRVTNSKAIGENYEASFARLSNEFKKNEGILQNVFTPEEMNNLRQAQTLLGYFKAGENRATTGSQTAERLLRTSEAERLMGGPLGRGFELVVKHIYGNLQGGGMVRRMRLMVGLLPTSRDAATEVAKAAFFNPEVAAYLLGKPVRNLSAIPTNSGLRDAIAADQAAQPNDQGQQ